MKHLFIYILLLFFPVVISAQNIISIQIDGSINPASAAFISSAIEKATIEKAPCLIIRLNTPGGLLKSTRVIVSSILSSPVPVVVYVSPSGAHAGSAGVFITMAGHVAAMAPGTNIGAAHPVNMQGSMDSTMNSKTTNDAVAFIKTIAGKRNRNLQWAEDAVRNSVSITEDEALAKNVVDVLAADEQELLKKINGKQVKLNNTMVTLNTTGATVVVLEMSFVEKLLDKISDPNIAYILMMLGFYGILFELYSPGAVAPGVVGGICLILGFYSMHTLPLNYAALALIIFGIVLFILEISIVSHGLLSIGGVIAIGLGSLMLIRTTSGLEFIKISKSVIITTTAFTALFFAGLITLAIKGQKTKTVTGMEGMIGEIGEVLLPLQPAGTIKVHGETWKAHSSSGPISSGSKVRVMEVKDLLLIVEEAPTGLL